MEIDSASPLLPRAATLSTRALLSAMMFLEFFVWGAWYVTCGNYMADHGMKAVISLAYTVGPLAAIVSPFFLGIVADRFFACEKVLGALMVVAALAMFGAAAAALRGQSNLFIFMLLIHMLAYMPTLGLTNTIALSKLSNAEKQFPIIRVFGTLGWIAANLVTDHSVRQFYLTGGAAAALAVLSLFLPHTPAPAKGKPVNARAILGLDALALMKSRSFAVFIVGSFLICIPLAAYFTYAPVFASAVGFESAQAAMSLGRVWGIVLMTIIPVSLAFLSGQYLLRARSPKNVAIRSILICILLIAYIIFARTAGLFKTVEAAMSIGQNFEVFFMIVMPMFFAVLGVRYMLLAGMLAWVVRYGLFAAAAPGNAHWLVVAGIALHGICYDFFFVTGFIYVDQKAPPSIRGQAQGFLVLVTQGLGMLAGAQISGGLFNTIVTGTGGALMQNWLKFWLVPCIAAAVVLVIFFALFRDDAVKSEPAEAALAGAAT